MTEPEKNFPHYQALNRYVRKEEKGAIVITYRPCSGYEGMALALMFVFNVPESKYQLDLQWMSLGLDLYGDTLQESYVYQFESLRELLRYLLEKYNIGTADIPVHYCFDRHQFPDPIKDKVKASIFKKAWKQFRRDFRKGIFLEPSLQLVFSSLDESN